MNNLEANSVPFQVALGEELRSISKQREWIAANLEDSRSTTDAQADLSKDLVGLALSGGGIRSATFHLGILQAFAAEKLLPCFDYISAVSGGGFIAAWLSKWLSEVPYKEVLESLAPTPRRQEPKALHRLRQYSSYLTPRIGPLGSDNLLFVTTYFHQLVLHLIVVALVSCFILLYPRVVLLILKAIFHSSSLLVSAGFVGAVLGLTPMILLAFYYFRMRTPLDEVPLAMRRPRRAMVSGAVIVVLGSLFGTIEHYGYYSLWRSAPSAFLLAALWQEWWARHLTARLAKMKVARSDRFRRARIILKRIAFKNKKEVPIDVRRKNLAWMGLIAAFLILLHFFDVATHTPIQIVHHDPLLVSVSVQWAKLGGLGHLISCVILGLIILSSTVLILERFVVQILRSGEARWFVLLKFSMAAMLTSMLGVYVAFRLNDLVWHLKSFSQAPTNSPDTLYFPHLFVLILPLCILIGALSFYIFIGFLGRILVPHAREGIVRNIAILYRYTFLWTFVAGMSLYAPIIIYVAGRFQVAIYTLVFVASLVLGVLARPKTSGSQLARYFRGLFEVIAAYTFLSSVLIILSWTVSSLVLGIKWQGASLSEGWPGYWKSVDEATKAPLLVIVAGAAILVAMVPARFGINQSSMHMFYRGRLAWAFLGEPLFGRGRMPPWEKIPITYLDELAVTSVSSYKGPYVLFNAALNLIKTDDLAWQERQAANFIFSPLYCGYEFPFRLPETPAAYQPTKDFNYGGRPRLSLAQAMTISGSALGANMGFQTSPRVRFFNTLFNIRLGWWFPNPAQRASWIANPPRSRVNMLWDEFMGNTHEKGRYVYLTDGGHFENIGLYELVRRKCKLIVISDASEDSQHHYRGLGNAVQRCRTDFAVEVEIDTSYLHVGENQSVMDFAIGRIIYEPDNPKGAIGILVYLKSNLHRSMPVDVLAFGQANPDFPNQSTLNQWFQESHFESYRTLGYAIGREFARRLHKSGDSKNVHNQVEALRRKRETERSGFVI